MKNTRGFSPYSHVNRRGNSVDQKSVVSNKYNNVPNKSNMIVINNNISNNSNVKSPLFTNMPTNSMSHQTHLSVLP
jgi:hypothetical protein